MNIPFQHLHKGKLSGLTHCIVIGEYPLPNKSKRNENVLVSKDNKITSNPYKFFDLIWQKYYTKG